MLIRQEGCPQGWGTPRGCNDSRVWPHSYLHRPYNDLTEKRPARGFAGVRGGRTHGRFTSGSTIQYKNLLGGGGGLVVFGKLSRRAQKPSAREKNHSPRGRIVVLRDHGASCNRGSCRSGVPLNPFNNAPTILRAKRLGISVVHILQYIVVQGLYNPFGTDPV